MKSRHALLAIIDLARNAPESAAAEFDSLFRLSIATTNDELPARWPETLAIASAVEHAKMRGVAADLLHALHQRASPRVEFQGTTAAWNNHICSLAGLVEHLRPPGATMAGFTSPPALENWFAASDACAQSRGEGWPRTHWRRRGSRVDHLSGHNQWDYLFYRSPLEGNYEVECDVTHATAQRVQLLVAGTHVSPRWDFKSYEIGTFRDAGERGPIDPMLNLLGEWIRYRVAVRDGVRTTWFNGRKIHEAPLPGHAEPWLAIRSWSRYHAAVRNLKISGRPDIPEQVSLTATPGLPGWKPYFDETIGGIERGDWWQHADMDGGGIVGRRRPELAHSGMESLLRYCRPMVEDGTIECEFYYIPGSVHAHPALDRLALMLDPGGVRIHWITDGKWDRTGLDPRNVFDEPGNRRGPRPLPLEPNAWNRLRLTLRGNTLDLALNDQLVYQRDLEPSNLRTFGLFHFAEESEIRVRNIVWRGDWPRILPGQQELADDDTADLDADAAKLAAVFEHDFAKDGFPEEFFQVLGRDTDQFVMPQPDGLHVVRPGIDKWSQTAMGPRFRVHGDFDITASFERLKTAIPISGTIQLRAALQEKANHHCRIGRVDQQNGRQIILGQVAEILTDGRRTRGNHACTEADAGRLRLCRRGDTVYFLFAEGDSPRFRVIATERVTTDPIKSDGIALSAISAGSGTTSVVWKQLTLRAERLVHVPGGANELILYVMRSDGTQLRRLTKPIGDLGSHGSPAWSPDGKRIAFDTHSGSTSTSHIYVIDADGGGLKDLGIGSMPTFSPDGRRIAFSWSGKGITVMNADGTNREVLDPSGWGAQWSPDGKSIAYGSRNITILDVATNGRRTILQGEHASRYSYIYWNMAWSRDSRQICFKGTTQPGGKHEIAIVDAGGSSKGFKILYADEPEASTDFSWHPDGKQILCTVPEPMYGGPRLFTLEVEKPGLPRLFPNQPLHQRNVSADWSPDGKSIVFCSQILYEWDTTENGLVRPKP